MKSIIASGVLVLAPIVFAQLSPADAKLWEFASQSPAYAFSIYLLWRDAKKDNDHRNDKTKLIEHMLNIVDRNATSNEKENSQLVAQIGELMKQK